MSASLSPARFTAVRALCWAAAAGLLGLAIFLLVTPVSGPGECPHLAKSLWYYSANKSCVRASTVGPVVGALAGSLTAVGAAIALRRRG